MRATAQDAEAARLMGISTQRITTLIFVYASVLAGIAGWLLAPVFYVSADMGVRVSLDAFAACILGGFGSIPGALIGGLLLGVIESLGGFYISSEYIDVIAFGVLFVTLVVRPEGIFGETADGATLMTEDRIGWKLATIAGFAWRWRSACPGWSTPIMFTSSTSP